MYKSISRHCLFLPFAFVYGCFDDGDAVMATETDLTTSTDFEESGSATDNGTSDEANSGDSSEDSTSTSNGEASDTATSDGPSCGNGMVDLDEECDDGNTVDTDDCTNTCVLAVCGDGVVWSGGSGIEECDNGPTNGPGDACTSWCTVNICGDGEIGPGEECDDDNLIDDDDCTNACVLTNCGDGILGMGEECDDGNDDSSDACTNMCLPAVCGDGVIWTNHEECDNALANGPGDECTMECLLNVCGDGVLGPAEGCDDANANNNDGCTSACVLLPWKPHSAVLGDGSGVHQYPTLRGDMNGDGRSDLVFVFQGNETGLNLRTKFSDGDGSWTAVDQALGDGSGVHQYPTLVGDVNGDGRSDLLFLFQGNGTGLTVRTKLADGDGTWTPVAQTLGDGPGVHQYPTHVGDVNGDGRSDLIFAFPHWDGTGLHVRTKLSDGGGSWTPVTDALGDGSGIFNYPMLSGDVNGDGLTDLIFMGLDWNGPGLNIRTKLSNGDGQWTAVAQALGDGSGVFSHPVQIADVNGDGLMDLVFVFQGNGTGLNVHVKLSDGDGTWTSVSDVLGDGPGVHTYPMLIGDVNADGRGDLLFVGQSWSGPGLNIRAKLSDGDGTWTSVHQILGDGPTVHTYPTLVGDMDGDGRTDLFFAGQGWDGGGLNIRTKQSQM